MQEVLLGTLQDAIEAFALPYCLPTLTATNNMLAIQLVTSSETLKLVPDEGGYVPLKCTTCSAIQAIA